MCTVTLMYKLYPFLAMLLICFNYAIGFIHNRIQIFSLLKFFIHVNIHSCICLTVHRSLNDGTPQLVVNAVRISSPLCKIQY